MNNWAVNFYFHYQVVKYQKTKIFITNLKPFASSISTVGAVILKQRKRKEEYLHIGETGIKNYFGND